MSKVARAGTTIAFGFLGAATVLLGTPAGAEAAVRHPTASLYTGEYKGNCKTATLTVAIDAPANAANRFTFTTAAGTVEFSSHRKQLADNSDGVRRLWLDACVSSRTVAAVKKNKTATVREFHRTKGNRVGRSTVGVTFNDPCQQ